MTSERITGTLDPSERAGLLRAIERLEGIMSTLERTLARAEGQPGETDPVRDLGADRRLGR